MGARGINCPTGGCDANVAPLSCDAKVCPRSVKQAPAKVKPETKQLKVRALPNVTAVDEFCCNLCSCEDGCTDCDPYVDEARGINCPTGGCAANVVPLSCDAKVCPRKDENVASMKAKPESNAAKMNFLAHIAPVDEFCCNLGSCEDGCTDCDPYVDEARGITCPTGGCDANVVPLSCDAKVCPRSVKLQSQYSIVV